MTADHITRAEFLAALERVASAMPVRNPAVLQFTELLAAELRRENKAKKAAEPTGAAIAFGPSLPNNLPWRPNASDEVRDRLGMFVAVDMEGPLRFGMCHRVNNWPALHASEAALRAEVERLRERAQNHLDAWHVMRERCEALRAARDRALAVLDAGHTAAYDLVADVREELTR